MPDNHLIKLRLTFWHGDKAPGDVIEVRPENAASWKGYAVPVDAAAEKAVDKAPAKTVTEPPKSAAK
ncbi:hypothetical protein ACIOEX_01620 [Streptomyces sp. NPDC087850]|uniref:hypothetical protein n=1 Tax=Streptomyces sp. NPDC087850 TaxID=3365809 RepID=UPI0037F7F36C